MFVVVEALDNLMQFALMRFKLGWVFHLFRMHLPVKLTM